MPRIPQLDDDAAWAAFVEAELTASLPPGWRWIRTTPPDGAAATWEVHLSEDPDDWFGLEMPPGAQNFIVFCGNSDAGVGGPHLLAQQARVIPRLGLMLHSLRDVLAWIFTNCPPNMRGLS